MMQAQVFTLYPEVFPGPLNKGIYSKAMVKKLWSLKVIKLETLLKINIKQLMILLTAAGQVC